MTHLADAVNALLRPQELRIHYLPGLPAAHYTVRAPCLLAQLADAIHTSTGGRGGRTIPDSRVLIDPTATQLWVDITTAVHHRAQALGVDRRPYLEQARIEAVAAPERRPRWVDELAPWWRPTGPWQPPQPAAPPVLDTPPLRPVPLDGPPLAPRLPAVGRLLRAVAAAALLQGPDELVDTLDHQCRRWAERITTLLAGTVEERDIRGAACPACRESSVLVDEAGDMYRRPAIAIRVVTLPHAGPDDLWVYRWCRACSAEGWLDYTTTTDAPGPSSEAA